jgi:cytochrome c oxidase subunit 2
MEIHRFEKLWIAASLVLIVAFIGTVTYGAVGVPVKMVDDEGGQIDPDNLQNTKFAQDNLGVHEVGSNEYDVYVLAQRFSFQPGTSTPIRVPADSTVTFYVTTPDVIHGFEVVGTNVNTMVVPGQVAKITVHFDDPGSYGIVCNEYCGAAHHAMEGRLEVVPRSEWESEEVGN